MPRPPEVQVARGDEHGHVDPSGGGGHSPTAPMLVGPRPAGQSVLLRLGAKQLAGWQLAEACGTFLKGLRRAPDDEYLQRGFAEGHERFKVWHPQRWYEWPWQPVDREEEAEAAVDEPPGGMAAVALGRQCYMLADDGAIALSWDGVMLVDVMPRGVVDVSWEQYTPRTAVTGDACDGYHVETCEVCPIGGPGEWVRAYKGPKTATTVRGCSPAKDTLIRVRAYNRKGGGEWSEPVRYRVAPPRPPPRVEVKEMPPLWRTIDIEDVIKNEVRHTLGMPTRKPRLVVVPKRAAVRVCACSRHARDMLETCLRHARDMLETCSRHA